MTVLMKLDYISVKMIKLDNNRSISPMTNLWFLSLLAKTEKKKFYVERFGKILTKQKFYNNWNLIKADEKGQNIWQNLEWDNFGHSSIFGKQFCKDVRGIV